MKTNKISVVEKFQQGIKVAIENYYRQAIPENIKRA